MSSNDTLFAKVISINFDYFFGNVIYNFTVECPSCSSVNTHCSKENDKKCEMIVKIMRICSSCNSIYQIPY